MPHQFMTAIDTNGELIHWEQKMVRISHHTKTPLSSSSVSILLAFLKINWSGRTILDLDFHLIPQCNTNEY